jgi:hypothetical protein
MTNGTEGCGCGCGCGGREGDRAEPELMSRMARVLGVDELLGPEARAVAAERCAACTDTDPCRDFLETAVLRGADHAPGFCRNRETFDVLASEAPSTI